MTREEAEKRASDWWTVWHYNSGATSLADLLVAIHNDAIEAAASSLRDHQIYIGNRDEGARRKILALKVKP